MCVSNGVVNMSNEEKIEKVLEEAGDWLTIAQVSERAELSRQTAAKYLHILEAKGEVEGWRVGSAKLFRSLKLHK